MASEFLKRQIEKVEREMTEILFSWGIADAFISKDEQLLYDHMTGTLELALSLIKINGEMITGDAKEVPERCLTCKYNVRDSGPEGDWFCACTESEFFTEQTDTNVFVGCSKWENGTNEKN